MRTYHPRPQAERRARCRTLLALGVSALAASTVPAQTAAPVKVAAVAPAKAAAGAPQARAQPVDPMLRAATSVLPAAPCGRVDVAPAVQESDGKSTVNRPSAPIKRIQLGTPENSRAATPKEPNEKAEGAPAAATRPCRHRTTTPQDP